MILVYFTRKILRTNKNFINFFTAVIIAGYFWELFSKGFSVETFFCAILLVALFQGIHHLAIWFDQDMSAVNPDKYKD